MAQAGFSSTRPPASALITLALICATPVLGSRLQRIVGDEPRQLDEWELQQRHRAMSSAYALSMGLVCAGAVLRRRGERLRLVAAAQL
jgi:hypothetical protein